MAVLRSVWLEKPLGPDAVFIFNVFNNLWTFLEEQETEDRPASLAGGDGGLWLTLGGGLVKQDEKCETNRLALLTGDSTETVPLLSICGILANMNVHLMLGQRHRWNQTDEFRNMLARDDHGIKIPLYFTLEISNKEVAMLRWAQQCGLKWGGATQWPYYNRNGVSIHRAEKRYDLFVYDLFSKI